ncbi:hypothetical protein EIP91_002844 [Steccherinum ochraceum]|uniref:Protein-S-isoprenylcysteine O-methyltransferase n=1 Tax=Steccherinum ochraceum TaxID=92696 RepID=A0A4R0RD40_9APHY|nr:hypothetical protein EIP91_002844 [Steccherinum ochraceum]
MSWYLPTVAIIVHILSIAELYVTLAAAYPSIRSSTLLLVLLPSEDIIAPLAHRLRVTPVFVVGSCLCIFGAVLRLACYRWLGRYFTLELALLEDHKLITDGPYRLVRHPGYLGIVSYAVGLVLSQYSAGSWWIEGSVWSCIRGKAVGAVWLSYVAFCLISVIFIRVPKEDMVLRKAFGLGSNGSTSTLTMVFAVSPATVRLPVVVANAALSHWALLAPNAPPPTAAQDVYHEGKRRDLLSTLLSWYMPIMWFTIHAMNFFELVIVLADLYPPVRSLGPLSMFIPGRSLGEPLPEHLRMTPVLVAGAVLALSGSILRIACFRYLGRHFTFQPALLKDHKLFTGGPYGVVRHPAYTGAMSIFVGLTLCHFGPGSWWADGRIYGTAAGVVIAIWWMAVTTFAFRSLFSRIPKEDQMLRKEFGRQWDAWSKQTPYRLLPGVY